MMKYCLGFIFCLWNLLIYSNAKAQTATNDYIILDTAYKWIRPEMNLVQFYQKQSLENFYKSWKKSNSEKVVVVMLGDSHLQNGAYPDQLKRRMHKTLGNGGEGLMFAFSAANTYSNVNFKPAHKGTWIYSKSFMNTLKLPLGVSGMAVRADKAPASLSFTLKNTPVTAYNTLKIFFKRSPQAFDISLDIDGQIIDVKTDTLDKTPYITVQIPDVKQNITLNLVQNRPEQRFFEFYGISLESNTNKGAIVHNGGVGAAKYNSVLRQELFEEQLPHFQPDLVIIDFGTNDYLITDRIESNLENQIKEVIQKVRKAAPQASILLTTAQDLFWRKINIKSGLEFSEIIHRVASENNCAVYDWYWVAGGQTVMRDWVQAKIAQNDMVHLNEKGYRLKGDMLFEALQKTISWMDANPTQNKLVLQTDSLKAQQAHLLNKKIYAYNYAAVQPKPQKKKDSVVAVPVIAVKNNKNTSVTPAKKVIKQTKTHTVVYGDTLYGLALKYRVSVENLMKWNGLTSSNLNIGKVLIVKP